MHAAATSTVAAKAAAAAAVVPASPAAAAAAVMPALLAPAAAVVESASHAATEAGPELPAAADPFAATSEPPQETEEPQRTRVLVLQVLMPTVTRTRMQLVHKTREVSKGADVLLIVSP